MHRNPWPGLWLLALAAARALAADATAYVDTDTTLVPRYLGVGVQWDPNDRWDYTPAQWHLVDRRVDFLRPAFIRCCLVPSFYCSRPPADGAPAVYTWDTPVMRRLYHILDYCQAHDVTVLLGEWGPSFGLAWDDPRWSTLIGECLDQLIRVRGYTCIRYYNKINEPRGDEARYRQWRASQQSLHDELVRRRLSEQVTLVGPDHSEGRTALDWVDHILRDATDLIGAYETHWYASSTTELPTGQLEAVLRQAREHVDQRDPQGREKLFFMGEAGTGEWVGTLDSNRYIRDFAYGVSMSDYLAQTMRAGLAGVSAWMLDDPMHQQPGAGTPGVKRELDFKVWGLWNTLGEAAGTPDDVKLRPWFYTWSLLSRSFPRNARIVGTNNLHLPGGRAAAAVIGGTGRTDLSLVLVNNDAAPRTVRLVLPNAQRVPSLRVYHYFDTDRPTDADGFPVVRRVLRDVPLATGLDVALPGRGVVLLTSLDEPTGVTLGTGAKVPIAAIAIARPAGGSETACNLPLPLVATTEPGHSAVAWSVTNPDGTPTDRATIGPDGVLRPTRLGPVKVVAHPRDEPDTPVSAALSLTIIAERVVCDDLDDWSLVTAHSGNLTFDTLNTNLFEGDPSRLKRFKDTPEFATWHLPGLVRAAAKLYFIGELGTKARFSASPDQVTWTPLTLTTDAAVPTEWQFKRVNGRLDQVPPGMNYLRLELSDDPQIFSPQLAQIRLYGRGQ